MADYVKANATWYDYPNVSTPIAATKLNIIEAGVAQAINSVPSAGTAQQIAAAAATDVVLKVKGFAAQSANLLNFLDSADAVKSYVDSAGQFVNTAGYLFALGLRNVTSADNSQVVVGDSGATVTTATAANVAATVSNTHATPTGKLLSLVKTATEVAAVSADGAITALSGLFTKQTMVDGTANEVQLRVQGHSTQTAKLQTWENSAGTVVAYVENTGLVRMIDHVGCTGIENYSTGLTCIGIEADRNIAIGAASGSYGGGKYVAFIANANTVPASNPTGGGVLYAEGGALKWRGSSGTITTLGAA